MSDFRSVRGKNLFLKGFLPSDKATANFLEVSQSLFDAHGIQLPAGGISPLAGLSNCIKRFSLGFHR